MQTAKSIASGPFLCLLAAAALIAALPGCAPLFDSAGFGGTVNAAAGGNDASDEAMAELAKGDYSRAEKLATAAWRGNSSDPYAAYVLAEVYMNTGRPDMARKQYEAIVSMNAQQTVAEGGKRVALAQVARERLASMQPAPPPKPAMEQKLSVAVDEAGTGAEASIIRRFKTLQRLLEEGLITKDEFDQRRSANLGALMPYMVVPPAANLDLPAPAPSEIVDRMKTLVAEYQNHSISATQAQRERLIILDALLPGLDARRADPPQPITGAVQAAEVVGRLTRYREAGVITADEETDARKTVMKALQDHEAQVAAAQHGQPIGPVGEGIQLGTYGSEDRAMQGWAALQKEFPKELGSLQSKVVKVALRHGGAVWRLNAGPLADRKAALAACRIVKRRHQTCVPTVLK